MFIYIFIDYLLIIETTNTHEFAPLKRHEFVMELIQQTPRLPPQRLAQGARSGGLGVAALLLRCAAKTQTTFFGGANTWNMSLGAN